MEIWSELRHPNIVQLIGTLRRGEKIYLLSEFIDGKQEKTLELQLNLLMRSPNHKKGNLRPSEYALKNHLY